MFFIKTAALLFIVTTLLHTGLLLCPVLFIYSSFKFDFLFAYLISVLFCHFISVLLVVVFYSALIDIFSVLDLVIYTYFISVN